MPRPDTEAAMFKLILDHVYEHEAGQPGRIFLTQPLGGGRVADYTWAQVLEQSRRMAAHLQSLDLPRGARVAILSKNCAHFIMAELAIWLAGGTTVAIYPTETAETVGYVLDHSEASLLFVGKLDSWAQQQAGVPAGLPCIALPLAPSTAFDTWDTITARHAPLAGNPQRTADEIAMLNYTSGSTGRPKGVMLSFGAISRAAEGVVEDSRARYGRKDSRILSYLPLAHVFERVYVEAASLVAGDVHIFFAESLDTFLQDLQRARPTMFISVPRLWLKFQQGVFAKMPPAKLDRLLGVPIIRGMVAKKVLKGLGLDAVQLAGSGSAPLPADLIRWYRKLGLQLIEGYGMTEDSAYSFSANEQFNEPGCVGVARAGVQMRLSPEGEILIKSPGQFSGYYKQPELTAESFTEDGFFRTGDRDEQCRLAEAVWLDRQLASARHPAAASGVADSVQEMLVLCERRSHLRPGALRSPRAAKRNAPSSRSASATLPPRRESGASRKSATPLPAGPVVLQGLPKPIALVRRSFNIHEARKRCLQSRCGGGRRSE